MGSFQSHASQDKNLPEHNFHERVLKDAQTGFSDSNKTTSDFVIVDEEYYSADDGDSICSLTPERTRPESSSAEDSSSDSDEDGYSDDGSSVEGSRQSDPHEGSSSECEEELLLSSEGNSVEAHLISQRSHSQCSCQKHGNFNPQHTHKPINNVLSSEELLLPSGASTEGISLEVQAHLISQRSHSQCSCQKHSSFNPQHTGRRTINSVLSSTDESGLSQGTRTRCINTLHECVEQTMSLANTSPVISTQLQPDLNLDKTSSESNEHCLNCNCKVFLSSEFQTGESTISVPKILTNDCSKRKRQENLGSSESDSSEVESSRSRRPKKKRYISSKSRTRSSSL